MLPKSHFLSVLFSLLEGKEEPKSQVLGSSSGAGLRSAHTGPAPSPVRAEKVDRTELPELYFSHNPLRSRAQRECSRADIWTGASPRKQDIMNALYGPSRKMIEWVFFKKKKKKLKLFIF